MLATLSDNAYSQLEELIVTLKLAPGSVVSEAALSRQLGTSRTPVREALQHLEREGLVRVLPQRGIVITELDADAQLRLLYVRRELERLMARTCAAQATDDERAQFLRIAQGLRQAAARDDDDAFLHWDMVLNNALVEVTRNEFIAGAMRLMASLARRFWYAHRKELAATAQAATLHASIAQRIAEGSPEQAALAADALMDFNATFSSAAKSLQSDAESR